MSALSRLVDWLSGPPPAPASDADITVELRQISHSALIDLTNRKHLALRLIDTKLHEERVRGSSRDVRRMNDLLEIRNVLEPGSRILPVRRFVPVNPGRWS